MKQFHLRQILIYEGKKRKRKEKGLGIALRLRQLFNLNASSTWARVTAYIIKYINTILFFKEFNCWGHESCESCAHQDGSYHVILSHLEHSVLIQQGTFIRYSNFMHVLCKQKVVLDDGKACLSLPRPSNNQCMQSGYQQQKSHWKKEGEWNG